MQAKTLIFDTTSNHKLVCDACGGPIAARMPIRITIFVWSVSRNRVTHRPACSAERGKPNGWRTFDRLAKFLDPKVAMMAARSVAWISWFRWSRSLQR
jgi:hypothetical protein